jgi:type I restriction enzyme S subunit
MIYQLAVTGALTPQLKADGDVSLVLSDIELTRQRLVSENKYKRLPKLESEALDIPRHIELPSSWRWTRLLDIGEISPRNDADDESPAGFISMSGIPQLHRGRLIFEDKEWGDIKNGFTHFANGDVVLAKITPCFENGKAAIISGLENAAGIGAGTTELHVFRPIHPAILPGYVYLFLRSPHFKVEGLRNMTGTAGQRRLTTEYFATRALPLPPTEEQSRIVAKVDELMALCDRLEVQQQQGRSLQNKSRRATLQSVVTASPGEVRFTWTRLSENFANLFRVPDDVDEFLEKVRDLAVRGLLTPSTNKSPNLSDIVKACSDLRARYIANGTMRKQKFIATPERDVNYPKHWAVAPFDDVAVVIGGVTKGRNLRGKDVLTCPYLSVANVQRGFFNLSELKQIQIARDEFPKYQVQEGDLLITEGGDWDKVGRAAIWRGGIENCVHQNHVFKARVPSGPPLNDWLEIVFNSGVGREYFGGASKQTTNLASINMTQLRSFPIPIPPLPEQQAILEKVQTLAMLCDAWRDRVSEKQKLASLLASTAVSSITGIATATEEEEQMKVPNTQVIAPLLLGQAPDVKTAAPLAAILAHHNGEMGAKDLWQRFGGEIDAFYAQLKQEVAQGWIREPEVAAMRERETI